MKLTREAKELVEFAESLGFAVVRSKRHIIVQKCGHSIAIPKTPSDKRAVLNGLSGIRKLNQLIEERNAHDRSGNAQGPQGAPLQMVLAAH